MILRGAAGFALGLLIWIGARPLYNNFLSTVAAPVLRKFEPAVTWVRPVGDMIVADRNDLPRQNAQLDVRLFTFNTILLFTLFASNPAPLSRRNLSWLFLSGVIVSITHVIAVVAGAQSVFSHSFGAWSDAHYSALAADASLIFAQGYMLVGGYATAFGLWWSTRPLSGIDPEPVVPPKRKTRGRAKRPA